MLEKLRKMFVGKRVRIIDVLGNSEGICQDIHPTPREEDHFDIELERNQRFGFVPEVIAPDYVDGELRTLCGGRRKIEITSAKPIDSKSDISSDDIRAFNDPWEKAKRW